MLFSSNSPIWTLASSLHRSIYSGSHHLRLFVLSVALSSSACRRNSSIAIGQYSTTAEKMSLDFLSVECYHHCHAKTYYPLYRSMGEEEQGQRTHSLPLGKIGEARSE